MEVYLEIFAQGWSPSKSGLEHMTILSDVDEVSNIGKYKGEKPPYGLCNVDIAPEYYDIHPIKKLEYFLKLHKKNKEYFIKNNCEITLTVLITPKTPKNSASLHFEEYLKYMVDNNILLKLEKY